MLFFRLRNPRPTSPIARRYARLGLEVLESRLAPASLDWSGGVSQAMSVAANYIQNQPPAAGDSINFNAANSRGASFGSPIADAALVGNLSSISLSPNYSGTLEIARNLTLGQVGMMGASVQTITIDAGQTLAARIGGIMGGTITGAGTLSIGNANLPGMFMVFGPTTLSMATMSISTNSSMTISSDLTLGPINLTNLGTINWTMGNIIIPTTAAVTNAGSFAISGGNHDFDTGATFTNNGVFSLSLQNPLNVVTFGSTLNNTKVMGNGAAQVNVTVGTLDLSGISSSNSSLMVSTAASSTLTLGGTFSALSGASILRSGNLNITGTLLAAANTIFTINPDVNLSTGALFGPGAYTLNGILYCTEGIISSTTVEVARTATFFGTASLNSLTMTNSILQFIGGTWNSGQILLNNSILKNFSVFNVGALNAALNTFDFTSQFVNESQGTVNLTAANIFSVEFVNSGAVNLNGNTLKCEQGFFQQSGMLTLGGGTLNMAPLAKNLSDFNLNGGTLIANGTITNGNVNVLSGTLELSGVLTVMNGNLTLGTGATVQVDASAAAFGQANVSGQVTLAGNLTVSLAPGYVPAQGTKKTILTAGAGPNQGFVGGFDTLPAGWQVNSPNGTTRELQKQ